MIHTRIALRCLFRFLRGEVECRSLPTTPSGPIILLEKVSDPCELECSILASCPSSRTSVRTVAHLALRFIMVARVEGTTCSGIVDPLVNDF